MGSLLDQGRWGRKIKSSPALVSHTAFPTPATVGGRTWGQSRESKKVRRDMGTRQQCINLKSAIVPLIHPEGGQKRTKGPGSLPPCHHPAVEKQHWALKQNLKITHSKLQVLRIDYVKLYQGKCFLYAADLFQCRSTKHCSIIKLP